MNHKVWVAHVVVQAQSPLAIGTGQGDDLRDALFAATPLGLPYLPATSLAGVLRSHIANEYEALFGTARSETVVSDARSRVWLSNGLVHDQRNQPQPMLPDAPDWKPDPILQVLAAGVTRDHVRIGKHGAADGRGKFDDTAVLAGARFSFQLRLQGASSNDREAEALRALLTQPLRVGGKTRRGYGKLEPVLDQCWERAFDLTQDADRKAWSSWVDCNAPKPGKDGWVRLQAKVESKPNTGRRLKLPLQAVDHLVFGGGHTLPAELKADFIDRELPSRTPWTEQRLVWHNHEATLTEKPLPVLPGTGIKGALRHRTEFHLRRIKSDCEVDTCVEPLFGRIRSNDSGSPGNVFIDDVVLQPNDWQRAEAHKHVSLDRFTGGPMPGLLFDDITLLRPRFDVLIELAPQAETAAPEAKQAFVWALRDLIEGRLGLGAGQNAGYGFVRLADPAAWTSLTKDLTAWMGA